MNRTSNRPRKPVMKLQFMNLVRDCVPCEQTNGLSPIRKAVLNQVAAYFDSHNTKFCMPYDEVTRYWAEHRKALTEVQFISIKLGLGKRATTDHLKALAQWGWIRFENVSEVDGCYDYRINPPHEMPSLDGQYVICVQSTTGGVHPNNTPPVVKQHAPCIEKTPPIYNKDLKTLKTLKTQEKGGGNLQDQSEDEQAPPPAVEAEEKPSQEEPPPISDADLGLKAEQPHSKQPTGDNALIPDELKAIVRRKPQGDEGPKAKRLREIVHELMARRGLKMDFDQIGSCVRQGLQNKHGLLDVLDNDAVIDQLMDLADSKSARVKPAQRIFFALQDYGEKGRGNKGKGGHDPTLGGRVKPPAKKVRGMAGSGLSAALKRAGGAND